MSVMLTNAFFDALSSVTQVVETKSVRKDNGNPYLLATGTCDSRKFSMTLAKDAPQALNKGEFHISIRLREPTVWENISAFFGDGRGTAETYVVNIIEVQALDVSDDVKATIDAIKSEANQLFLRNNSLVVRVCHPFEPRSQRREFIGGRRL